MANDLAHDLIGPAIVGFGAALLVLQGERPVLKVLLAELEVALFAVAVLRGGMQRAECSALALDKHREPSGDVVVFGDGQGTMSAHKSCR